jgi:hypothetical protein
VCRAVVLSFSLRPRGPELEQHQSWGLCALQCDNVTRQYRWTCATCCEAGRQADWCLTPAAVGLLVFLSSTLDIHLPTSVPAARRVAVVHALRPMRVY